MRCTHCGCENNAGDKFCFQCGLPLEQPQPDVPPKHPEPPRMDKADTSNTQEHCPHCGTPVVPGAAFCENCGGLLNESLAVHPEDAKKAGLSRKIWIGIGAAAAVIAICAGGWMVFSRTPSSSGAAKTGSEALTASADTLRYTTEDSDYRVLYKTALYTSPFSEIEVKNTYLNKDETVRVLRLAQSTEAEGVWVETEAGWAPLESAGAANLEAITLSQASDLKLTEEYLTLKMCELYASPSILDKTGDTLSAGEVFKIHEQKKDQYGTLWVRLEDDTWMIAKDADTDYISGKDEVEVADSADKTGEPAETVTASAAQEKSYTELAHKYVLANYPVIGGTTGDVPESKMSGVHCCWMAQKFITGSAPEFSSIAAALGTSATSGTSSADIASYLSQAFRSSGASYTAVNIDLANCTIAADNEFLNVIRKNVDDGFPTIVCLNEQTLKNSGYASMFATITGYGVDSDGQITYLCVADSYTRDADFYPVSTVLSSMKTALSWFTYIH